MENAAKALYIAGSVLIAGIVISLLVNVFSKMGRFQETEDKLKAEQEIIAFNREYEAFDKKIMYGTDVISCINKAVNHNEKYVVGNISGNEALIQVCVYLKESNPLEESFEIYHLNDKGKEVKLYNIDINKASNEEKNFIQTLEKSILGDNLNTNFLAFFGKKAGEYVNGMAHSNIAYYIGKGQFYATEEVNFKDINKSFTRKIDGINYRGIALLDSKDLDFNLNSVIKSYENFKEDAPFLYTLTKDASDMVYEKRNSGSDKDVWSSIKWTTVFSNFKKRKFKCNEIHYNDDGLVDGISFIEK